MRKLLLALPAVALLALPASSLATKRNVGDGCLVVKDGRGAISITARGALFGRVELSGDVILEDLDPTDGKVPVIFGWEQKRPKGEGQVVYSGSDMRLRASGRFRTVINATGINLSVVGRGTVTLSETDDLGGFVDAGEYSIDTETFCEDGFVPMPEQPKKIRLGATGTG